MTTSTPSPLTGSARAGILTYMGISALVYVLMMSLGLVMRLTQATWLDLPPNLFYEVMTAHGAGMVGISGLAGSGVIWYFLRRYVDLSTGILWANLTFFLTGVVLILGGIFLGGYAGGWTFLFPLPAKGLGAWGVPGAASFLIGLLLIGVGFLLLYLDFARAIIAKYGSLGNSLGWPQLFGGSTDESPPAAVIAATMVLIVNIAGILAGAVVLVLILVNLFMPEFALDPLLTKNLTYFFGHVFINATIYQAVVAVYEILPEYTKRPWKVNKVFLAAWTASTVMVMAVYPHHLLLDFAMPTWALVMGQIFSYLGGFPILVVTGWGALTIVHRSGIEWDMAARLLFLSIFGWCVGVVPAVIDGTIAVNQVMHNTMWVPGHFHMYLIVGLVAMLFGFMYYLSNQSKRTGIDKVAFWLYLVAGVAFSFGFLTSGMNSIPRRWAVHLPEWVSFSQSSSAIAAVVALAALVFALRFLTSLKHARTT
ncbi:MAG: cbb3-type cytochrome c oxidase subunit I [Pseudomonadales bacterium]|nr:cbb3-type cytochrome c oxidase subunit I [Pseudomonadales bacterium]MBL6813738.1 cbb3-type cytochrome c oxidase subunit I [Pseudomonadales bacterium]